MVVTCDVCFLLAQQFENDPSFVCALEHLVDTTQFSLRVYCLKIKIYKNVISYVLRKA